MKMSSSKLLARTMLAIAMTSLGSTVLNGETATTMPTVASASTSPAALDGAIPSPRRLSVAVLDFEATTPGSPDLGKQISEVLLATMSGEDGVTLVDRASMAKTLQEHELNLTGLVDPDQAVRIGKLVGAQLLVTGKAFVLDKQIFITAKIIGTETSLVDAVLVKGPSDGDLGPLVLEILDKLISRIHLIGPKLMPADDASLDPVPLLKKRLAGRKLPKLAVAISENHVAERIAAGRVDPAVETEVKRVLLECGFIIDDNEESRWSSDGVEVVVNGEAFSEFQARIGTLVSCSARAEMSARTRKTGQILFSDRATTRAADLAENTAGKTALQSAGRRLAIALVEHLDQSLPPRGN